jgi:hypothetical protein
MNRPRRHSGASEESSGTAREQVGDGNPALIRPERLTVGDKGAREHV